MDAFAPQELLPTLRTPKELRSSLVKSTNGLALELKAMLSSGSGSGATSVVGVAVLLNVDASLEALAFATAESETIVIFYVSQVNVKGKKREVLTSLLTGHDKVGPYLVAFGMARVAMHIRANLGVHVRGVNLADAMAFKNSALSPGTIVKETVDPCADTFSVNSVWEPVTEETKEDPIRLRNLCLRAWLSAIVASKLGASKLDAYCPVDTSLLPDKYFEGIYKMLVEVEQMDAASSRIQENDFDTVEDDSDGKLIIHNARYKTRIRASGNTEVHMIDENGRVHYATARNAVGRQTHVSTYKNRKIGSGARIERIEVHGREELSHAERARDALVHLLLQGKCDLRDPAYELVKQLYFPEDKDTASKPKRVQNANERGRLNQSQANVVEAMVESEEPFVLVHGPPGTGKTSTISAAVREWVDVGSPTWIIAQSNVAVKNIAERLVKDRVAFRILVSREFYDEWHEHIYDDRVKESLIRTDEIPTTSHELEVLFNGVHVVLCTLSTLSNPVIERRNVHRYVPVTNLVVDEASQIGIFNYLHVLAHHKSLRKACFFGDPKQLPPYGQEAAPTLQCIFDVKHLKRHAYFLNTQYRMPVPLGSFISEEVYNKKLRSEHESTSSSCIAFVDAARGQEEKQGESYRNAREVQTIVHLVRHYYAKKNYCVITPYDAQRSELERALRADGLNGDNVYNVDSFQGNEADYILLSIVRTSGPGFLVSRSRANVMLTRCRRGMVIVTQRAFVKLHNVQDTLLGRLASHWKDCYERDIQCWWDWRAVAEGKADMPGCPPRSLSVKIESACNTLERAFSRTELFSSTSAAYQASINPISPAVSQNDPSSSRSSSATQSHYASSISSPYSAGLGPSPFPSPNIPKSTPFVQEESGPVAFNKSKLQAKTRAEPYSELFPELPSLSPSTSLESSADRPEPRNDAKANLEYAAATAQAPEKPWGALVLNRKNGALRNSGAVTTEKRPRPLVLPKPASQLKLKKPQQRAIQTNTYNAQGYDDAFPDMLPEPQPTRAWNAGAGIWRAGPPPQQPLPMDMYEQALADRYQDGVPRNDFVDAIWGPVKLLRPDPAANAQRHGKQRRRGQMRLDN